LTPVSISNEVALVKLQQYCAYQDRCHTEVRTKLLSLHVYGEELEEIMSALIQEKYLDELRYAKSYARGKFNIKKWGRNKIKQNLKQKQISDYCIRKAMLEINDELYIESLQEVFEKKLNNCTDDNSYTCKQKAIRYCIGRGYEQHLVYQVANVE